MVVGLLYITETKLLIAICIWQLLALYLSETATTDVVLHHFVNKSETPFFLCA